jgi:hypothetical protein
MFSIILDRDALDNNQNRHAARPVLPNAYTKALLSYHMWLTPLSDVAHLSPWKDQIAKTHAKW